MPVEFSLDESGITSGLAVTVPPGEQAAGICMDVSQPDGITIYAAPSENPVPATQLEISGSTTFLTKDNPLIVEVPPRAPAEERATEPTSSSRSKGRSRRPPKWDEMPPSNPCSETAEGRNRSDTGP